MNNINTLNIFKRYTDNYILKVDGLFNLLIRNTEDQLEKLEELLTKINSIYKEQIMKSYINYYEMCEDLMRKKNYKVIFELAVDNNLHIIKEALLKLDMVQLEKGIKKLFSLDVSKYDSTWIMNADGMKIYNEIIRNNKFSRNIKNLIMNQYNDIDIYNNEDVIVGANNFKKRKINEFIKGIEEKIEAITGERKLKEELEKINQDISYEYLKKLFEDNNFEMFVIKLVVKLEAKLRHYLKKEDHLEILINEIANNYKNDSIEKLFNETEIELLHKLRMIRNKYVHSSKNDIELSSENLEYLLGLIEEI